MNAILQYSAHHISLDSAQRGWGTTSSHREGHDCAIMLATNFSPMLCTVYTVCTAAMLFGGRYGDRGRQGFKVHSEDGRKVSTWLPVCAGVYVDLLLFTAHLMMIHLAKSETIICDLTRLS